ncbi:MAG TPA: hypothetical protein VFE57_05145 [Cyclobacteriaceae bacterium]|jgi:hypothetical protein|nr:hypothetical protein [Cyclobacteriaceae bacterium]
MIKRILLPALLILFVATVSLASEVDGKWTGIVADQYEFNIKVKAEGEVLTGVAYVTGTPEIKIMEGVIKGNEISFKITSPEYGEIPFTGKVDGDKMTFTLVVNGSPLNTELKRAKE